MTTNSDEPRPYSSGDVMQNVRDLYADMERARAERGPFLRELRCGEIVLTHLTLNLPRSEREPWEPQPWGVPVIQDEDVPALHLRLVYDDGSTEDRKVISDMQAMLVEGLLKAEKDFTPPPMPDLFSAYCRSSAFYAPITRPLPPIWGP